MKKIVIGLLIALTIATPVQAQSKEKKPKVIVIKKEKKKPTKKVYKFSQAEYEQYKARKSKY